MNKAYIVSLATGVALGFGAGNLDILTSASAAALDRFVTVEKTISKAASANLQAQNKTLLCAEAEAEAGLQAGECEIHPGTITWLMYSLDEDGDISLTVRSKVRLPGTWILGEPQ